MSEFNPVIIVAAYNRPRSLKRLLSSLLNAKKADQVRLIISIDNQEPLNNEVRSIAEAFEWPFGEKEVRYQPEHLGLRKHILQCGDLSREYGSVIILEDDLYVSPYFYDYAVQALGYYENDINIGGISLYNQKIEEITNHPFTPVYDDSDVCFLQFPSSLGQAWTVDQWDRFRTWYDSDPDLSEIDIPEFIKWKWPETSWKKYFCAYLSVYNRYFVFPRGSFTTNFNDPGTNLKQKVNHDGQAQLNLIDKSYHFKRLTESYCLYDSYLSLLPGSIKHFVPELGEYDFEMDMYGTKEMNRITKPFVITSKPVKDFIRGFERSLKPHEMNIIFSLEGEDLCLCRKEDVLPVRKYYLKQLANHKYFYSKFIVGWKAHLYYTYQNYRYR